jgi:predicted amidohydrolase YtcJ
MRHLVCALSLLAVLVGGAQLSANLQNSLHQNMAKPKTVAADLILTNAKVYTIDAARPWAKAVAIRAGEIVGVADSADELKPLIGPDTEVMDLHGQFVMPGFNDAHTHIASAGFSKLQVNLEGTKSIEEFQQRIRDRLSDYKPGEWITGRGWDHTLWPEQRFPTRQDLDAVSRTHPMFFDRVDGHVAVANSKALAIAGITRATKDPPGSHIERDPDTGEPTGMLEEDAAKQLVYSRVPPFTVAQRRRALELALGEATRFGVTSVQDYSVQSESATDNFGWQNFLVYLQMKHEGKLNARITEWLPFDLPLTSLQRMRLAGGTDDPWLKTGALKAFLDGSLGARTAALLEPYSDDPSTSGILRMNPLQLKQMAIERDRAGFQLAFHAIGDRANQVALDTFAAVAKANGKRDRRDRIEHAQVVAPPDFVRFAALGVVASMQPSHLLDDERWAEGRIGPVRILGAYAWDTILQNGVHLAFGTDYPVESIDPLRGIYACVTRELPEGGPQGGWYPQEKLSIDQCLRAYTAGSAYAEFEDKRKGKIAMGQLADLVVYPDDITQIPPAQLLKTRVAMTIVGGRIVYQPQQPEAESKQ